MSYHRLNGRACESHYSCHGTASAQPRTQRMKIQGQEMPGLDLCPPSCRECRQRKGLNSIASDRQIMYILAAPTGFNKEKRRENLLTRPVHDLERLKAKSSPLFSQTCKAPFPLALSTSNNACAGACVPRRRITCVGFERPGQATVFARSPVASLFALRHE